MKQPTNVISALHLPSRFFVFVLRIIFLVDTDTDFRSTISEDGGCLWGFPK
jgi:hypothetical protein